MPHPLDIFGASDPLDIFGREEDPLDLFGLPGNLRPIEGGLPTEEMPELRPASLATVGRRVGKEMLSGAYGAAALGNRATLTNLVSGGRLTEGLATRADRLQQSAGFGHPGGEEREALLEGSLAAGNSPVEAAIAETAAALLGLADPTDLAGPVVGGATALGRMGRLRRLSRAASAAGFGSVEEAAEAVAKAERAMDPELETLKRSADELGTSPPSSRLPVATVADMSEGGSPLRRFVAFDAELKPLGEFEFFEEAGHLRPSVVTTGKRGSGVARKMYREAVDRTGKPIGPSMSQTAEGAAFRSRLQETDPDLFAAGELPIGAVPGEGKLRPPEQPFQYNAESLDLPRSTLPAIKGAMESPEVLARRRTGIKIDYDDPAALKAEVGWSEADFIRAEPGTVFNREQGALLDSYVGKYGREMETLRPLVTSGSATPQEVAKFTRAKDKWIDLLASSMAGRSEAGRALESYKHLRTALETPSDLRSYLARKLGGKLDESQLDLLATADLANPDELSALLSRIQQPKWWEYPRELFYSSILSGIGTHGRNLIGNAFHAASQVPVRFAGALIDAPLSKLTGRQRQVYLREVLPSMYGLLEGFDDGLVRFVESWRRGAMIDPSSGKFDLPRSALARAPNRFVRERVAPVVAVPFRALTAVDELFKGVNRGAELRALAVRSGVREGKSGADLTDHVTRFMADPPEAALKQAVAFEQKMTFTNPLGETAGHLERLKTSSPFLGYIVPFVKTPVNLFKRGAEFTPLNLPRAVLMAKKGAPEASQELAKVAIGAGMMGWAATKAMKGELVGPPPSDPAARDAFYQSGKRPFSLRFGDRWFSFSQVEPLAMPLALVAAGWEGFQRGEKGDATHFERLQSAMALLLANQLDRSYLSGLGDLVELKTFGQRALVGFAGRQAAALTVPFSGFSRGLANMIDPRIVEKRKMGDFILENIPLAKGRLPGRLTRFGEEIRKNRWEAAGPSGTPAVPVKVSDDEIEMVLEELGLRVGFPGRSIEGVELSPDEYRVYLREAGQRTKNVLGTILRDETFRQFPQSDQQKVIDTFVEGTRDSVRAEALFGLLPEVPPLYVKRQLAGSVDIFGRGREAVSKRYNEKEKAGGRIGLSDLRKAREEAEAEWSSLYGDLGSAVADARRQGLSDEQIVGLLRRKGISTRVARALVAGKAMSFEQYHRRSGSLTARR